MLNLFIRKIIGIKVSETTDDLMIKAKKIKIQTILDKVKQDVIRTQIFKCSKKAQINLVDKTMISL